MKPEEIREVFREHGKVEDVRDMYLCRLLEVRLEMKDGTRQIIMLGEESFIDITNDDENDYVCFGSTLIEPMANIKSCEAKWRAFGVENTYGECKE